MIHKNGCCTFSVQQPCFFHSSRFLCKQPRDAADSGHAHHRKHDARPDGAAAAQQPAHKVKLEQAHKPPVDAANYHQDQAHFIKGLHKKTSFPLGVSPLERRLCMLQHPLRADDPRAAPIGPGHIHLRPLRPDSLGGASGSFFALKDAKTQPRRCRSSGQ